MSRKLIAAIFAVLIACGALAAAPDSFAQQSGLLPDLVPVSIELSPENPEPNDIVNIVARIRNQGFGSSGSFFVNLRANQQIIFSRRISGLIANEEVEVSTAWQVDPTVSELSLVVDTSSLVNEENETNNTLVRPTTFAPDLVIEDVQFIPEFPKPDEETRILITVANRSGTNISDNIGMRVFLGKNDQFGLAFIEGGLAAGESQVVEIIKSSIPRGEQFIRVLVDHTNAFVELDESNNSFERLIDISTLEPTGADLAVRSVRLTPSDPNPGDLVTVNVVVENVGTGVADAVDVSFQVDGNEADRQNTPNLQPGASASIAFQWVAENQERILRIKVDPSGVIPEPNEMNNSSSMSVDARAPLPAGCGHYVWLNVNDEALQIMSQLVGIDTESVRSVFLPKIRDIMIQQFENINVRFTFDLNQIPAGRGRATIAFTGADEGNILGLAPIGQRTGTGFVFMGSFSSNQLRARPESRQVIIIATVASHELGHLFGLGHTSPNDPTDIMSANAEVSTGTGVVPPEFTPEARRALENAFPTSCLN